METELKETSCINSFVCSLVYSLTSVSCTADPCDSCVPLRDASQLGSEVGNTAEILKTTICSC